MPISLAYGSTTIALPDDLSWPDEFQWAAVEMKRTYSIAGRLLVETTPRTGGRPITLQGADDRAWTTRDVVQALQTAANLAGQVFTLTLRGDTYSVQFDHTQTAAMEAVPVVDFSDPDATDFYVLTLRFFTLP